MPITYFLCSTDRKTKIKIAQSLQGPEEICYYLVIGELQGTGRNGKVYDLLRITTTPLRSITYETSGLVLKIGIINRTLTDSHVQLNSIINDLELEVVFFNLVYADPPNQAAYLKIYKFPLTEVEQKRQREEFLTTQQRPDLTRRPEIAQSLDQLIGHTYSYQILMKKIPGRNLYNYLLSNLASLNYFKQLKILIAIFDTLETLHEKGLIHGDLNFNNIQIEILSEGHYKIYFIDFGLSYRLGEPASITADNCSYWTRDRVNKTIEPRPQANPYHDLYPIVYMLHKMHSKLARFGFLKQALSQTVSLANLINQTLRSFTYIFISKLPQLAINHFLQLAPDQLENELSELPDMVGIANRHLKIIVNYSYQACCHYSNDFNRLTEYCKKQLTLLSTNSEPESVRTTLNSTSFASLTTTLSHQTLQILVNNCQNYYTLIKKWLFTFCSKDIDSLIFFAIAEPEFSKYSCFFFLREKGIEIITSSAIPDSLIYLIQKKCLRHLYLLLEKRKPGFKYFAKQYAALTPDQWQKFFTELNSLLTLFIEELNTESTALPILKSLLNNLQRLTRISFSLHDTKIYFYTFLYRFSDPIFSTQEIKRIWFTKVTELFNRSNATVRLSACKQSLFTGVATLSTGSSTLVPKI
ncbi:MAG: hypothetical protein A3E87_07020 [Gammaproteobacteria bacterium RIFCSPHIGHO2_12_FULL_35_23]|nr:MAG: hypothetical protein A3E87_07020 [Gammaproteobacteria bacterium RIFCSPHIGHO2_12_FULL_35_23]